MYHHATDGQRLKIILQGGGFVQEAMRLRLPTYCVLKLMALALCTTEAEGF